MLYYAIYGNKRPLSKQRLGRHTYILYMYDCTQLTHKRYTTYDITHKHACRVLCPECKLLSEALHLISTKYLTWKVWKMVAKSLTLEHGMERTLAYKCRKMASLGQWQLSSVMIGSIVFKWYFYSGMLKYVIHYWEEWSSNCVQLLNFF